MKFIAVGISILSLVFSTLALVNNRGSIEESDTKMKQAADWSNDDFAKEIEDLFPTCQEDADGRRFAACFGLVGQKPTCSCAKTS